MADSKTFVLVGNFQDNITPALEKINNSIDKLKRNLNKASYSGGFGDLTKSIGKVISAHKNLNKEVTELRSNISKSIPILREYRKEAGKVVSANAALGKRRSMGLAAKEIQSWERATRALNSYNNALSRGGRGRAPTQYAAAPAPRTAGGGRSRVEAGFTGAVAGGVLGNQLANAASAGIVQGFQVGVRIMEQPFRYFQKALGERIADEMSDLKAAGGYFAIAKRQKDPFVTTMDEAIQYTQKNNQVLAKLASALPGSTQDYIEVSKRLSDTITRVVSKDLAGAVKEANRLRSTAEGAKFYGAPITETTGKKAAQDAITTLLGEMTKKTVLAGFGGRAGAGGAMGPYGLPGLTERLISQENVSVAQFQRYAAIFSDPQILDALTRNIDKVNATQKDSIDRYQALSSLYDEILPPELVEKFRRSVKGINEALYSAALNPEVGFLGIGRKLEGLGRQMNDFGQYVDETGKVVTNANQAARINISIYEILRDIYAQTAQVLTPIVEYLPQLWDPLRKIGDVLIGARDATAKFLLSFNRYREGLKVYAKGLKDPNDQLKVMESLDIRASLAAINNLFRKFGVFDTAKFKSVAEQIKSPTADIGKIMGELIDKFFESDIARKLGEFLGRLIGTVLRQVADATQFVSGVVEGGGFAGGFASAFKNAGGFSAIQDIYVSIIQLFLKAIITAITEMPLLSAGVAAFALLPTIIGAAVTNMVQAAMSKCAGAVGGTCPMPGAGGRGRPRRYGAGGSIDRLNRMRRYKMGQIGQFGAEAAGLGYEVAGRPGAKALGAAGGAIRKVGKFVPGGALAAGALDLGMSLATGENFGKAAVGAFGTVLGGAAGTIFGPVGTAIGSMAGNILAEKIYNSFDPSVKALANATKALEKYGAPGQRLGGVQQILSGTKAKDLPAVLNDLAASGKISAQELKALQTSGFAPKVAQLEKATAEVERLKKEEALAEAQNLSSLDGIRRRRIEAEKRQQAAAEAVAKTWESFSAGLQTRLIRGSDGVVRALDASRDRLLGWIKGIKFPTSLKEWVATFGGGVPSLPGLPPSPTQALVGGIVSSLGQPKMRSDAETKGIMRYKGGLGDAISSELKHKPPGSKLVVANSSETIIPAAGGIAGAGMLDFVRTLQSGFSAVVRAVADAKQQQQAALGKINQTLVNNQQQTNLRLTKLETKFTTPGLGGLGGGSMGGGVDAFTPVAQRYGLQMTSGYRPGDPGWHGANRARDYSNSTGPTSQMMQFAQYLASTYGSNLKELIYTPLGFSIKNGQRVAPYAQGSHYNHVHVAYGLGAGNPAFFSSAAAADKWETAMARKQPIVSSVRATASELGGGNYNVTNNFTITQQPGQDPDTLASLVVMKLSMAIDEIRNHTA